MSLPPENLWNPVVTIITPSYNQGSFIERTIQSILAQDYPSIEHIVVDGGSNDQTLDVLKRYEKHLRWISEKDSGQSEAINKGFRMAKGDILTWLNSDDTLLPGAVSKAVKYFNEHPDVMMIYGEGYMVDENDIVKQRFPFTEPRFDLTKLIYQGDYILQQSTFYRREIFKELGMLREDLHYGMDWDFFIRIGKRFRVEYVPEYFGNIREHAAAKTMIGGKKRFRELVTMLREHGVLKYPPAYFNYAWDAYGKPLFPDSVAGASAETEQSPFRDFVKRIGLRLASFLGWQKLSTWHADGWVEKDSIIVLPNLKYELPGQSLVIEGTAQRPNVPLSIQIRVNRNVRFEKNQNYPGDFTCRFMLPPELCNDDAFHVEIRCSRSFNPARRAQAKDNRNLAFMLKDIRIQNTES